MRHAVSSAIDEAAPSIIYCGTRGVEFPPRVGLILLNRLRNASYVVKNTPAPTS